LWAELFVLTHASQPAELLSHWRITEGDRFDFADEQCCLEVKSSAGRSRHHRFSFEQLHPRGDRVIIVASLQLESSAGGATISDFVERLVAQVPAGLRLRVLGGVAEALGSEWQLEARQRYDEQLARDSLRFYSADNVPSIAGPLPDAVSDVRFTVDLTTVPPLSIEQLRAIAGMLAAAVPARGQ
jgi:hypothetical protein